MVSTVTRDDLQLGGLEIIDHIMAFECPDVVERFAFDRDMRIEDAQRVFVGLKQFFVASSFIAGYKTPSMIIDEMWHTFVLHMRHYEDFCQQVMGGTVYHDPGKDDAAFAYYPATRAVAAELCGDLDEMVWPSEHDPHPRARCVSCDFTPEPRFVHLMK